MWVLENDAPRKIVVTLGITDGQWTEVVSGDLQEGDRVITETTAGTAAARPNRPGFGRMF